ncbi:uncharacterized protein LOC112556794 [Pomacea canaliculata]|uniref:uncharacterized protein LOC112556794 n=1 Tax=Pomacea canaliculata TaxID=400727 RepID=UPI000D725990|nr:uncharacterized protein LOC112556794 [Pomacea canaliculata]
MAVSCYFLTVFLVLSCSCTCLRLADAFTVSEPDDISRSERQLLLSVLINLNKFLRLRSTKVEDDTGEITDGQIQETFPKSDLESILDARISAAKRARSDLSGVLPPWNEFCRMMHITSCVHSRQR